MKRAIALLTLFIVGVAGRRGAFGEPTLAGGWFWTLCGLFFLVFPWLPGRHGIWREKGEATRQRIAAGKPERGDLVALRSDHAFKVVGPIAGLVMFAYGLWRLTGRM